MKKNGRSLIAADLPLRDGVGASCVALPAGDWRHIADFMVERFPAIGRGQWHARMASGEVFDEAGIVVLPCAPYRAHSRIFYYRSLPPEPLIPFEATVLYQDELLIAVDKPHFLPVTPSGAYLQQTLLVRLKRALGIETLAPMHRLDRDTAGVVLLTVQPNTRDRYHGLFREKAVRKTYEAIAPWRADLLLPREHRSRIRESATFMQMQEVDGAPNAETAIALQERQGALARYQLCPATGQKHQLRLHMAALGIPILNDRIYPTLEPAPAPGVAPDYDHPLQLLARAVEFTDPVTGQARYFASRRTLLF